MKRVAQLIVAAAGLAVGTSAMGQTYFAVVESGSDKVVLLNTSDGSVANPLWIDLVPQGPSTPIEALVVGDEVWVSDQVADAIFIYTLEQNPQYVATIRGGMDNIRGMEHVNGKVYVTNAGSANGATANSIVRIDAATRAIDAVYASGDFFDLISYNGNLLCSNIGLDDIEIRDLTGGLVQTLVNSDGVTGIDFPQQMVVLPDGKIAVSAFSPPDGLYIYNADGSTHQYYDTTAGGLRGVALLDNGSFIITNGSGVHTFDPATGGEALVLNGQGRFVTKVSIPVPCAADFDGDGFVDFFDFDAFVACFEGGACPPGKSADFDGDGFVDFFDFDAFVQAFEEGC